MMETTDFVLLRDIDYFGWVIHAGTIYRQVNSDHYHPIINKVRCPNFELNSMVVKNNPKVFLEIKK